MSPTRYPSLAHRKQSFKRGEARDAAARAEVASWPGGIPPQEPAREISYAEGLLPDLPGRVHGLVAEDPVWVVQCDGCGRVAVGDVVRGKASTLVIQFCGINFVTHTSDPRRLCFRCRLEAGLLRDWDETARDLAFHEKYMQDRAPGLFDIEAVAP